LGVYIGQTLSLAKRLSTHINAANDGSHKNPVLASCLSKGDYLFRVIELVEIEFDSQRHLRSYLLGREAYWISKTDRSLNIYPPERPALDVARIQAKLVELEAERSAWEKKAKKFTGFIGRALNRALVDFEAELQAMEYDFKRQLGFRAYLEAFLPTKLRTPIPFQILCAREDLKKLQHERASRDRFRSECLKKVEKLDQEIFDEKFIGFQCGLSIEVNSIEPLKGSAW
jgi:hypothetical protein